MTYISFTYELPSGQTIIGDAEIIPGIPELSPSIAQPGAPEEPATVEICDCFVMDPEDEMKMGPLFFEGLFIRRPVIGYTAPTYRSLEDALEEAALDQWDDEQ